MKNIMTKILVAIGSIALITLMGCESGPKTVTIQPVGDQMMYATTEFTVKPGQEVHLIMDNTATLPIMKHNIIIVKDSKKIPELATSVMNSKDFIPTDPTVIAATPLAEPGQKTEVTFVAPTEEGTYTYFCSYPGHYALMQGKMIVSK